MDIWTVDYDGGLLMRFSCENTDTLRGSVFYKLSLKRYVRELLEGFVRFKSGLTYLDYKKVISLCERETDKQGIRLIISERLTEYIESKEIYIDTRSKLGIEMKLCDTKLKARFEEYHQIVDNLMSRELREKQMRDSFYMCAMQKSGNFSVPGSGKTASVLGMYSFLKSKGLVRRIVVILPKNAFGSWIDEFNICFNGKEQLKYFNLHSTQYGSVSDRRRALQYEAGGCNLLLFNYESVGTYCNEIISLVDSQTLLVFDEVHKVKRIDGERAVHAIAIAQNAIYVVAMTGTPIPNTYMDIYNFLHILFPDEYNEFFGFEISQLRNPSSTEISNINNKIQPFFCRTTKNQLSVPVANEDSIITVSASEVENRMFRILQMKYRKNKLALMIRVLQLESNPKLLLETLDLNDFRYILDDSGMVKDIDYVDYTDEVKNIINSCVITTKFNRCIAQAEALSKEDKPIIIWCIFVNSILRLSAELNARGIRTKCIFGDVPLEDRLQIIEDFKQGIFQVLLTNPHTLAESVSLHSVCHDAIYFEYSYNLVHFLQSKDRIHRLGLPEGQYTQYYYMQTDYSLPEGYFSMDEQIYLRLKDKEKVMLNAIDNNVLESLPTDAEELELIFSKLFK